MDGKSIKEEQPAGVANIQGSSKSPPSVPSSVPISASSSGSTSSGPFRSGKENRLVGSSSHINKQSSTDGQTHTSRNRAQEEFHTHKHQQIYSHPSRSSSNSNSEGITERVHTITSTSPTSPLPLGSSGRSGYLATTRDSTGSSLNMLSNSAASPSRNGSVTPGVAGGGGSSGESSGPPGVGITTTRTSSVSSNSSNSGASNVVTNGANLRHLLKIKRFLGTLLHFGCEISSTSGERVRNLVFNVVSGHLSIEEFHRSLQEVTSFPLRPFVLPFLRAHLPILQREVSNLARVSKQTPLSYIQSHEQSIIDSGSSPGEPCDIFHSEASEVGGGLSSGKRKLHDSFYDNGEIDEPSYSSTPKRHHGTYSSGNMFSPPFFLSSSTSSAAMAAAEFRDHYASSTYGYSLYNNSTNSGGSSGGGDGGGIMDSHALNAAGNHEGISTHSSGVNHQASMASTGNSGSIGIHLAAKGPEDEWKNIHVMLNCILSMVEKTKRALNILQNRTLQQQQEQGESGNSSSWLRRPHLYSNLETSEELKRQTSEMIAHALKTTEDRVSEVKRRAEEAVQEVKRQAVVEVRRAVAAAEARACDAVASERSRLERILMETASVSSRRTPGDFASPLNSETVASGSDAEACWNCGRKAHETCSGCNVARYCSSFCQHKDWENHHKVCGRNTVASSSSTSRALLMPDNLIMGKQQNNSKNGTSKSSSNSVDCKNSIYSHHLQHISRDNSNSPPCANSNEIDVSGILNRSSPQTEDHSQQGSNN